MSNVGSDNLPASGFDPFRPLPTYAVGRDPNDRVRFKADLGAAPRPGGSDGGTPVGRTQPDWTFASEVSRIKKTGPLPSERVDLSIRDIVDVAIDEDRHAPCLWVPAEHWAAFSEAVGQAPNRIGVIIYRRKTVREGAPYSEVTTRRPD